MPVAMDVSGATWLTPHNCCHGLWYLMIRLVEAQEAFEDGAFLVVGKPAPPSV
jgi:hypothetical protein